MTPSDLDAMSPAAVAALVGLEATRDDCWRPCPACGAMSAHPSRRDRRGPVWIGGGWRCWACGVSGSRGDLVARVRVGRPYADLDASGRRALWEGLGGAMAGPGGVWVEPPPRYLEVEVWEAIVRASVPARRDRACREWAAGRGLVLSRDALALPARPVDGLPLWGESDRGRWWMPAAGYSLLLPMADHTGRYVAGRLRCVRPAARVKELAIPGYSSAGAVYVGWRLRERWLRGERGELPCALVEGGPDWLAASMAWPERDVIGYVSGSTRGSPWARWLGLLHPDTVVAHQIDAPNPRFPDRVPAGQGYAAAIREAAPWVRAWPMTDIYARAGVAWGPGRDLGDLARERVAIPRP